jgi:hypothetical protein
MAIYGDADSSNNETNLVAPATTLKFNPIVEDKLIQKNKYKIEMVEWFDGKPQEEIDSMVIYPVELGFFVEFKNNKDRDFAGKGFRQTDILELNTKTTVKDGFFRKKEDILLEIIFKTPNGTKRLLVNVEDKHVSEIVDVINSNKTFDYDNYLGYLEVPYEKDGVIANAKLYPKIPVLAETEELLWTHTETEGVLSTHAKWVDAVTNMRIFQYSFNSHMSSYAIIPRIDDVIVTNQKRISESQSSGIYYSQRFGSMRSGQGTGKTTTSSITIGDVIFMVDGRSFITFQQIRDPHGLVRITKSVKKQATQIEKQLNKMKKDDEKRKTAKGAVVCQKCENPNLPNANFCSRCGITLK